MNTFYRAAITLITMASASAAHASLPPVESFRNTALDATIPGGSLVVADAATAQAPEAQIRKQLSYMLAQLNWFDASPNLNRFKIEVSGRQPRPDGTVLVRYVAKGIVVWDDRHEIEPSLELVFPERADAVGIKRFEDKYMKPCSDTDPEELTTSSFFYYFWPLQKKCPLRKPNAAEERGIVVRTPMLLTASTVGSHGKKPEYAKIWADNRLVVTAVFAMAEPDEPVELDAGAYEYADAVEWVSTKIGPLKETNFALVNKKTRAGVANPFVRVVAQTAAGEVEVELRLIRSVEHAALEDAEFRSWYEARTRVSDLVIYSGHAGLGNNINALTRLGAFTPGQYQIFLVNGCDTFSHLSEELFRRHGEANPGFAPTKHLDIIANGLSGLFSSLAPELGVMIDSIVKKQATYGEILSKFDPTQKAIVDGEEDNQ